MTGETMEIQEKADQAIRELLRMVRDSFSLIKSSIEAIEGFAANVGNPSWRYGMSVDEDNVAEEYANALKNVVVQLQTSLAEIESRDIDWDFQKK